MIIEKIIYLNEQKLLKQEKVVAPFATLDAPITKTSCTTIKNPYIKS
jgi:hypothetical protein